MAQITAVTFDLWQTLLIDTREQGRARAQVRLDGARDILHRFGETYDVEHIREAYRACYRQCHAIRDRNQDVSFREQVGMFINNISPGLAERLSGELVEDICRVYADSFFVHPPTLHAQAAAVLRQVKELDLRIGLISNTGMTPGVTFRSYLDQQGMLEYFDTLTFSDEVKLAKPAPEIFLMTVRSLGAAPAQTVHVGDHVENDVVGAKGCGLRTVWIEGFYPREDPSDPSTAPDASVTELGQVVAAIRQLGDWPRRR
ncbi:MAG TPA: HAD family hydrolase [Dehalococcoidia bacterium]|nr:HAD family hydrolase [Dehalococcoidia bacterium]